MLKSLIALVGAGAMLAACTTTGNVEPSAAGGAGIGALAGAAIGAATGGDVGTGAVVGAAVGGAAGAIHGCRQDGGCGATDHGRRQYYDERAGRYYYYDSGDGRYYWENGAPRS
jgi:hypothetical protein